ncbi:MAG: T9SS type A sorting domain-containing protein [Bacteroidetes bacterium]|nr:T9SS type A sorting domain-containing protein [Bacteroidota bacterium]
MVLIIVLLILQSGLLNAQQTRDEKLAQLKQRDGVKVTEVEKDIIKIEYSNGKVMYKNIADYQHPVSGIQINYSPTYDSTIIDLRYIDTTLYYYKYSFWQEVPLGKDFNDFLLVGDINNNSLPELYGQMKDYTTELTDVVIMEMNSIGEFDSVYSYDTTIIARSIYDIDKDGMDEVHLLRHVVDTVTQWQITSFPFYRKSNDTTLAKELSFVFQPRDSNSQQNDNFFGNWDGDEFTDHIFIHPSPPPRINIYEYNPSIPNFDSIYSYDYTPINLEFGGFAIEDFDQDGSTEFFAGSTHGDVLCIENNGNNSYAPTWVGMVETNNAYQLSQTNDVDKNGKKEIWVGGDSFYPGIGPMTRITIFETDGNDSYQVVGRIDLIGIFSFFAQNYQAVDVDKDGVEEMMVCIEQTVLILKFNGSPNHQTYELFYFKQNDLALAGRNSLYYGATMYDLNNDGTEELIINLDDVIQNVGLRLFSYIYKPNFTVDINDDKSNKLESYRLYPVYPNPFNPQTNIKFDIFNTTVVSIKVYNTLGKEVTTLLEKELSPGSYTISWEAKDSNSKLLPSGVYLIRFSATGGADNYTKTIKALLLK